MGPSHRAYKLGRYTCPFCLDTLRGWDVWNIKKHMKNCRRPNQSGACVHCSQRRADNTIYNFEEFMEHLESWRHSRLGARRGAGSQAPPIPSSHEGHFVKSYGPDELALSRRSEVDADGDIVT